MFATTHSEDEENKMVAMLKATEDKEDMKMANEEYENHKTSKKAQSEDPKIKELESRLKASEERVKKDDEAKAIPLKAGLVALRRGKLSESELTDYETKLNVKPFTDIQTAYENEKYLMPQPDSLSASTDSNLAFPGEQNSHALSAKSIDDILEGPTNA